MIKTKEKAMYQNKVSQTLHYQLLVMINRALMRTFIHHSKAQMENSQTFFNLIDQLVNAGLRRIRLTTGYASLHTQTFHTRFFIPKFFHIKTFHTQIFHTPDFSHPQFHTYFFIPRVFHTRDFSCPAFSDPFFSILLQLGAAIMVSMQILWHF